jgi:hypothetical protein
VRRDIADFAIGETLAPGSIDSQRLRSALNPTISIGQPSADWPTRMRAAPVWPTSERLVKDGKRRTDRFRAAKMMPPGGWRGGPQRPSDDRNRWR